MSRKTLIEDLGRQRLAWDPVIAARYRRFTGEIPLPFMGAHEKLAPDLKNFHINLATKLVTTLTSMVALKSLDAKVAGRDVSAEARELWRTSQLDDQLTTICNSTLALGTSWLSIWVDKQGKATLSSEPTTEMSMILDPVSHEPVAAAKIWESYRPDGVFEARHCVLYLPDGIYRYRADTFDNWVLKDEALNPLGVVPVVKLTNQLLPEDKHGPGRSVLDSSGPLIDAISRLVADLLTTSAGNALPQRYVTGLVLEDSEEGGEFYIGAEATKGLDLDTSVKNPLDEDTWILENEAAKVGSLPGAALDKWSNAVETIISLLSASSSLPLYSLGVTSSIPTSAESLRASRADMEAIVKAFLRGVTTSLEDAIRYMLALNRNVSVDQVQVNITWAPVGQREISKTADAILKLVDAGVLTTQEAKDLIANV